VDVGVQNRVNEDMPLDVLHSRNPKKAIAAGRRAAQE
jgi:hypothetical protein